MKIRNVEQLGLAVLNPSRASQRLAFWAMAIRAGVIAVALMVALITAFEVAAQRCRSAHLNGSHDAPLRRGHRRATLFTIGFPVTAEHVRHF
jgi:hypothetical protein